MEKERKINPLLPAPIRMCIAALCLLGSSGCVQITQTGREGRSIWVLGFARIKVPDAQGSLAQPVAFEITVVGLSLGRAAQLGYFRDFEVHLRPDSDSAVIIVRSKSDLENLKRILTELQRQHLCIVSQS